MVLGAEDIERKTSSETDTREVAAALAPSLRAGDVVALEGPLGAGKTVFVRGVCEALEVPSSAGVSSPSFALVHIYEGGALPVAHVDLYRLGDVDELEGVGFRDLLGGDFVVLIEWPERFDEVMAQATHHVVIDDLGPSERKIRVKLRREVTV